MSIVNAEVIRHNTITPIQEVREICYPHPLRKGYLSQRFPVYPIIIDLYVVNPPFDALTFIFDSKYMPSSISIDISSDDKSFNPLVTFQCYQNDQEQFTYNFHKSLMFNYIRINLNQPFETQENVCQQVWLKCIQFSMKIKYKTEFAYSLKKKLQYCPEIFRLLEKLEERSFCHQRNSSLHLQYCQRIQSVLNQLKTLKIDPKNPPSQYLIGINQQLQALNQGNEVAASQQPTLRDHLALKKSVDQLKSNLKQASSKRTVDGNVANYFRKYRNGEIRQLYLSYLSSAEDIHHKKALNEFWGQIKPLEQCPLVKQEPFIMFISYYLQHFSGPTLLYSLKILALFLKSKTPNYNPDNETQPQKGQQFIPQLRNIYLRVLRNVLLLLKKPQGQDLQPFLNVIYTIYNKIPNELFVEQLVSSPSLLSLPQQLRRLQILQKLTFHSVRISNKESISQFILTLLQRKNLSLVYKNKCYNVVAYLATIFGKEPMLVHFQKLNAMLLLSMERVLDKKMQQIKMKASDGRTRCQFCGVIDEKFKDDDIYDLHCFKQCRYLTLCQYCMQAIEIPQLSKHHIEECPQKQRFFSCPDCNLCVLRNEQEQHKEKCAGKLVTVCPLCDRKVQNKLQLKEHILKQGCKGNKR